MINGDDDQQDSHIMSFVKSAIHKNVDNMRKKGRSPFINGNPPNTFCKNQSAAPTCVIIMSCRAWIGDSGKSTPKACEARTQLRQTSIKITEDYPNILWDTNGPLQQKLNDKFRDSDCISRLCDIEQILTLDAHGATEIVNPDDVEYFQNQSNVFWVFPAITGLALTSAQYATALQALSLLWSGQLPFNAQTPEPVKSDWIDFLMGPQDPKNNHVKRLLQKITYPAGTTGCPGAIGHEASELSWRVYRPGDLMPQQSYSFWTDYSSGKFFRSGINTLYNILLTNHALSIPSDLAAFSKEPGGLNNFWQIFETQEMKEVTLPADKDGHVTKVDTLPLVPEVTFKNGQVDSINFKLDHLSGTPSLIDLKNLSSKRNNHTVKTALNGPGGWILNGTTNMKIFTGLCLPSLIDKIPVDMQFEGTKLKDIMNVAGYNVSLPAEKKNRDFFPMFRTETGDRWRAAVTQTCFHCKELLGEQIKSNHYCNFCGRNMKPKQKIFRCNEHDYDICQQCYRQYQQQYPQQYPNGETKTGVNNGALAQMSQPPAPPHQQYQQTVPLQYSQQSRPQQSQPHPGSFQLPPQHQYPSQQQQYPPPAQISFNNNQPGSWATFNNSTPATSNFNNATFAASLPTWPWIEAMVNPSLPVAVVLRDGDNHLGVLRQGSPIHVRRSNSRRNMWEFHPPGGQLMYIPKVVLEANQFYNTIVSPQNFPLMGGEKRKTRRKKNKRKTRRKKNKRKKKTRRKKNKYKRKKRKTR